MGPIPQNTHILLNFFLHFLLNLLILLGLLDLILGVGHEVALLSDDQFLRLQLHQLRLSQIVENILLEVRVLIGKPNPREGNDPAFPYFFEIVQHDYLAIRADDVDHFLHLLTGVLLAHAFQEERDVVIGQNPVFIDVDHLEGLSDLLVRVQLTVDLVSRCLMRVWVLVGDAFLLFLTRGLALLWAWDVGLAVLRGVDFDGVEDLLLAFGLVHEALMRNDA